MMRRCIPLLGLCLLGAPLAQGQQITVKSLLDEMTDLARLAKRPSPYFKTSQASSYDRASKKPGNPEWFANGDAGQYIREETNDGREERVMADLRGPGAVVRIWSANPGGTIRFYFDGEAQPRLTAKTSELLQGKFAPFGEPFSYNSSSGTNLYFPFPYAQSLKVTVDKSDNDAARSMYYQVGYRSYESSASVKTYDPSDIDQAQMDAVSARLADPLSVVPRDLEATRPRVVLAPSGRGTIDLGNGKPGAIYELSMRVVRPTFVTKDAAWSDPKQAHNVLRSILLTMSFDGEPCVSAPLGDFFGSAVGINPFVSMPFTVQANGHMSCRWVMPYRKRAAISLENIGSQQVEVSCYIKTGPFAFDQNTYTFRAQFTADRGKTRPMRDMTFLNARGEGCFIGSNLSVTNPIPQWWGEGDEKVYVDGEAFPSTFGTGTEDYYGYAWCNPTPFARPYHAQPRADGPGNFGHTSVNRWHVFDPIHFESSLRFDMEMWHWGETVASYERVAYWYAKPNSTGPAPIDAAQLAPVELSEPKGIEGATEGEKLKCRATGGQPQIQEGFWECSAAKQLWWIDAQVGDKLTIQVPVEAAGRYKVMGHFCTAHDYGKHRITFNGKPLGEFDFCNASIAWRKIELGEFDLPKGTVVMEVEAVGSSETTEVKRRMFGLDYLMLTKL